MGIATSHVEQDFWYGKRVFLTGHTGFKGSWLSIWLKSMGAQLHGFSLPPPTNPSLFDQAGVAKGLHHTVGDVRHYTSLLSEMKVSKPEIIIHMAAQPLVRDSYMDPTETYATNVMGTVNVFEAARHLSTVRAILNVTTDKCYDNKEWLWGYRENDPLGGHDPYSSSKACSELVTSAYRHSFFQKSSTSLASARAGNVIGGGDWAKDRLVPDILSAFQQSETLLVRNPHAVRPWQYVLEPLAGYLMLTQRLYTDGEAFAGAWNFGPHDLDSRPVHWIVERIAQLWGSGVNWSVDEGSHPHEAGCLKLDISKSQTLLGWQPKWSLSRALTELIDWYSHWLSGGDAEAKCQQQIRNYMASAVS